MALPSSLRQAVTVAKYELRRLVKTWRLISVIVLVIAFSVIAVKGLEGSENAATFGKQFFYVPAYFLITITGIALGADVLASEFERKTGYILFSNPIRRVAVVAGKFMACFISTLITIIIFYLVGAIFMCYAYAGLPATLLGSFGLAILYGCAVLSLTLLFSSVLGEVGAMVFSFSTLFMLLPLLQGLLLSRGIEPWFLLSYSVGTIGAYIDPPAQRIFTTPSGTEYAYPDFTVSALVMTVYILVSLILCIIATKRREMR